MEVTVLHPRPWRLERRLDAAARYLLQSDPKRRRIEAICGADATAVRGEGRVYGLVAPLSQMPVVLAAPPVGPPSAPRRPPSPAPMRRPG